jgi:hypothetical protein
VNGLAALPAFLWAFVLGQVVIETGVAAECAAAEGAGVLWLGFVIVAEHGAEKN